MVEIGVKVDSINEDDFNKILRYYNSKKSIIKKENDMNDLEKLDRHELGFQIKLNEPIKCTILSHDPNHEIRQLRFSNKILKSSHYNDFTFDQKILLFKSLGEVLGFENVFIRGLTEFDHVNLDIELRKQISEKSNEHNSLST